MMLDNNKKNLALQKDLLSSEKEQVIRGIREVAKSGSPAVVYQLLVATFKSGFPEALEEGKKVLFNIKDQNAVGELINALKDDLFKEFRAIIAASIWEAGLNAEDRLIDLVEIAVSSDYMTIVEISTIIENIESGFPYDEVTEASLIINEHLHEIEDESRISLLSSLAETLNSMAAE
ncbi:MAG: hypothetical protein CMD18_05710 [Flavobacteriales bacterium]|nr:hypothetical protein [Flavobacteriales bacterium]|tara:strand:+ start:393 stop:923 length:531 start_codon:yes stop_codon:yes gene_type:complete